MTREDTKNLIRSIMAIYPNWKPQNVPETINLWHFMLEEWDINDAMKALKVYTLTDTSGFAPSPGQLVKQARPDSSLEVMTEWAKVKKAMGNCAYNSEAEFAALSPTAQRAIGSAGVLREWGLAPTEMIGTFEAHFIRAYNILAKSDPAETLIGMQKEKELEVKS